MRLAIARSRCSGRVASGRVASGHVASGHVVVGALLGAVALGFGCDAGPRKEEPAARWSGPPVSVVAARSESAPAVALPRPGRLSLQVDGPHITLAANAVRARKLLAHLRDALRFEVEVAEDVVLPRAVTVRLVRAGIDDVLAEVLSGLPYAVFYAVDPDDGSRVLHLVRVGEPDAEVTVAALKADPTRDPATRDRFKAEVRARTSEEREAAYQANQDRWWDDLWAEDPSARAYAVDAIYLDDETFPIVADLLWNDPDPRVRVAAASTLADNLGDPSAADALVTALADPNSEVVIEALDALEDVGDASHIPAIERMLRHPDSDVQEAAIDALEWLAD